MEGFKITARKGFHITFANDVTVSVQFGPGNYCENYDDSFMEFENKNKGAESTDAEIGIWKKGGDWITKEYPNPDFTDDVAGRISVDELLKILIWAEQYKG